MLCGGSDAPIIPIGTETHYLRCHHPNCYWLIVLFYLNILSLHEYYGDHFYCYMQDWEVLWHVELFHREIVIQQKLLGLGTWLVLQDLFNITTT